jgi:hypothetical protein
VRYRIAFVAILLVVLAGSAARLSADPVMPPEKPRQQEVVVALAGGRQLTGTLLELSPAAVTLLVNGSRREYRLDDVDRIERKGDSLANGALVGAAILGGLCLVMCGQGLENPGDLLGAVFVNAGLGALVGVGIDALHSDHTVLYRAGGPGGSGGVFRPSFSYRVRF